MSGHVKQNFSFRKGLVWFVKLTWLAKVLNLSINQFVERRHADSLTKLQIIIIMIIINNTISDRRKCCKIG